MNRSGLPWMFVVLALLGWQVGGSSGGGTAATPAATAKMAAAAEVKSVAALPPASAEKVVKTSWREFDRLVAAYFGVELSSDLNVSPDLIQLAQDAGYEPPDIYIALVADPLDSFLPARFDQALAGIQEGFAQGGFLLDRIDLPWTIKASEKDDEDSKNGMDDPSYRSRPGILIFRRPSQLAIVLLVGETAKQGVHKQAFDRALSTSQRLTTAKKLVSGKSVERIRVLGPTFSGSQESLRLALAHWQKTNAGKQLPEVWLVSGSATSPSLTTCVFGCKQGIHFFRTVMADDALLLDGQNYLVRQLGWDPERIALLSEADTAYGRNASSAVREMEAERQRNLEREGEERGDGAAAAKGEAFVVKFPSGLSGLRKASEDAARGQTPSKEMPRLGPSPLAISLADQSRPVDVVPEFSILTTPTKDLALSNLLAVLCGEGKMSYLGIVASDSRDQIFLAERVQEICPDLQLFLLDSDLLLAHPQNRDALDGAIVLSSSALFTRGLPWLEPASSENSKDTGLGIRQFQSELQEGIVHAVETLLKDSENPAIGHPAYLETPHAWVSAIGNASIWPLAQLPVPPETRASAGALSAKASALTLSCLFVLIALSFWLVRVARPLRQNIPGLPTDLRSRGPFLLALVTIQLSWGVLLVVGGLPVWAFGKSWEQQEAMTHAALIGGVVLALVGLAAFLWRDRLPQRLPQLPALGHSLRWIAVICTTVAVGGLLAEPLLHGWMAGGVELFHFRARKFTGGMSPIVSLAWIGGGYFLWSIIEMKRRTLVAFQGSAFPIREMAAEEPILAGCRKIAGRLERRMTESSPTWPFWAVLALPLLFSGIYLAKFVQPVAEAHAYGRVFAGLAIGLFVLALVSFQRFLRLWAELSGLLERLETLHLGSRLKELSGEVDWRPMKSFAWVIPPFKMTELSIAKLGNVPGAPDPAELRRLLADAFEGHRVGDPTAEANGRQALQAHFDTALGNAAGWLTPGPLQDFVAVRLVSYVRTVFAHLRSSLLGALVPGFLLLLAISTYEIQPKRLLFLSIWSALAAGVLMTIWTFVHMDRNPTLSAIGGTTEGKADLLDRSFIQSVLTYGVLPLLGLVATRFPQVERLLAGYLNPLMRFVSGGGG